MIQRHDGPAGSVLFRDEAGRVLAGVGSNAHGDWTWWARASASFRQVAMSRADAIASAKRAAERAVA